MLAQSLNFIHEKSSDDIRDNRTLLHRISRKELSEAGSKEEADVKANVRCKDTISTIKDGLSCKDTDNTDLQQDLYSTVPCSSFSTCDIRHSQSWVTIYPSEARARLDDSDVFLSRAICTNVERRNYRRNNDRDNIRGDDSECIVCHAIDNRWFTKSIYTDCATYSEDLKECFTNGCKYRNKILQNSVINRNDIRKRQMGYKLLQQPLESCQREEMIRQRFMCSCIAEEEEDYCKVDRVEKELPENVCNAAESLEKISVCRILSKKLTEDAAVCEISFGVSEKHFEARTNKDSAECSEGTSMRVTRFGNSEEPPKVTRVCKEFVTEEPPEDITVCKTVFGKPNGLPGKVIVYKTTLPESKDVKETICKEIPDPNFASQDGVNRVSLSDAKDKLVEESTNNSNLNDPKQNAENKRTVRLNNKHDNVILNNFTGEQTANIEQDKQIKKILNNQSKNLYQISVESIKDSKPLSKNVYVTTLPPVQLFDRTNLVSNPDIKKTSKTIVKQKTIRMQSLNQSTRNRFQQSNDLTQNLTLNKNNQLEEKMQENSKEKEEKQDISKEVEMIEDKPRESLLHRPFKKLFDVIKRGRTFLTDKIETGKIEAKKVIANGEKKVEKSEIASENENKTGDIKDQQEITEKVAVPMKSPQIEIVNKGKL